MQQWQGPLPPPAALGQFNQIIPNGADRILRMVEEEQAFRIRYEKDKLSGAVWDSRVGKILGFLVSAGCIGGSVYTAMIGAHPTVSIALVSLPVMVAIRAFIGRK